MNNTELLELFSQRQSVRAYTDKPVEKEKLMNCIEAARIAPSASNAQPWKFIIIDDPEIKSAVASETYSKLVPFNTFSLKAPVLVAIVREKANFMSSAGQILKNKDFPLIDIGIAAIQFCLQATIEGLGTCFMGWFNEKKIKRLLNIPVNKRLILIITVGYSISNEIRRKVRKETTGMLSFNSY